jgi:hypothetical protein
MVTLDQRVAMSPDVVYRTLGSEAVVLNLETGIYFGLNEVGSRIWTLAIEHDLRTVCRRLAEEFDATPQIIENDVLRLVATLLEKGLVVVAPKEMRPL